MAGHEDLHALATPLPIGPIFEDLAAAHREQTPRIVDNHRIGTRRTQRTRHGALCVGPDHQSATHPPLVRMGDDGRDGDRALRADVVGQLAQLGKRGPRYGLDEDVDDAATGQAYRECGIVADSVVFQPRYPGLGHLGGQLIYRTLHAAARHRPTYRTVRGYHHRGPRGRGADRKVRTTGATPAVSPAAQIAISSASTSRTLPKVGFSA